MKRYNPFILIPFFLFFLISSGFCSEETVQEKVEKKLQELKRTIIEEETMLRILIEQLVNENQQLSKENAQLKETIKKLEAQKLKNETLPKPR